MLSHTEVRMVRIRLMLVELLFMQTEPQINSCPSHIFFTILLELFSFFHKVCYTVGYLHPYLLLYGVVNNCVSDISLQTSFVRSESIWVSLSHKISVGKPTLENTASKASAILSVSIWATQPPQGTL